MGNKIRDIKNVRVRRKMPINKWKQACHFSTVIPIFALFSKLGKHREK